jgi:hypothetical protein
MFTRNKQQAIEIVIEEITKQANATGREKMSNLLQMGLDVGDLLDAIFAGLEIEVEWWEEE